MAMVVQHNLTAMNANRQLGVITSGQAKSSEKLASGYRINRAGDDAAGLKISEKMRSQVRGLTRASTNAQDGVSLIQTAEGALNEAHSILQRMNELAVQGANDTNENIDRQAINEELNQLTEELDRISSTTQFNKMNLLDGTFQNKNLHVGANTNQKIAISINNMDSRTLGLRGVSTKVTFNGQKGEKYTKLSYLGTDYTYDQGKGLQSNISAAYTTFSAALANRYKSGNYAQQLNGKYVSINEGKEYGTATSAMSADIAFARAQMRKDVTAATVGAYATTSATSGTALASYTKVGTIAVDTYDAANAAIAAVQNAINSVSSQRSALGAIQNRLEHTIANLDNVAENTQAAESRIRDTDIASEMVEYSKNQILAQAGQSMLAQGNQSTQGVLSLLQ